MLPTTGFFKDIECPFFEDSCDRPYCHFRHRKKNPEPADATKEEAKGAPEVPTYNPTPKSQLANAKSHIPIKYVPDLAGRLSERSSLRKLQIDKFPTYKPTPLSLLSNANRVSSTASADGKDGTEEASRYNNITINYPTSEYNPNEPLKTDDIDFEDLANEFDMIDEIINEKGPVSEAAGKKDEKSSKKEEGQKANGSEKKSSKDERSGRKHRDDKKRDESSKSKREEKSKSDKSSKSSHDKEKSSKRRESSEKKKSEDKRKNHSSSSSKHKDKEKSGSSSRHKDRKDRHGKNHEDKERSSKRKDDKEKSDNKKRKSSGESNSDSEIESSNRSDVKNTRSDDESDMDVDNLDMDVNFDSEDDTLQECYRIFNEYKPEEPQIQRENVVLPKREDVPEEISVGKKRVAHEKAEKLPPKPTTAAPKRPADAAFIMNNRFKMARLAQANNEQKRLAEAVKKSAPPPAQTNKPTVSLNHRRPSIHAAPESVSLVDEIIAGAAKPKRIAPVQNVNLMQRAKAKIDEMARQKAAAALQKTQAQTIGKGAKRVAHVPEFSLSDIPDVLHADKSKLPVNVRTRYLTMIADECGKLYSSKEDAYQRALAEEVKCYERCKVLATYRNSAMLSINRLRKEVQEREKAGLDPMSSFDPGGASSVSSELKGPKFYEHVKGFLLTEDELRENGYPRESSVPGRAIVHNRRVTPAQRLGENERKCARCSKLYLVDREGLPAHPEDCVYHPLRKRTFRGESIYLCCRGSDETGCATSDTHVCDTPQDSDLEGFQTTLEPCREDDGRSCAVYALDCEMCYTTKGLELTRVTIVDTDCKTVYESLVKPMNPIVDYNTRFSGITREQMERTSTSILQVQANILHLCNSKTILIGHSLESDMKALKIVHSNVIDTAVLFPHKLGLPHKRALRALASDYLKKIIQNDISGHDSAEDALTCMELIIWKVREDLKVKGIKA